MTSHQKDDLGQNLSVKERLDLEVLRQLLNFQTECAVDGQLMSVGVRDGRTARSLLNQTNDGEQTFILGTALPEGLLESAGPKAQILACQFQELRSSRYKFRELRGKFRCVHIEWNSNFCGLLDDLCQADELLSPSGILIVGGFLNPIYPQIGAAVYRYIFGEVSHRSENASLRLLVIGGDMAILCRRSFFGFYKKFVLQQLRERMGETGMALLLAKTDRHPDFDVVSIRERATEERESIFQERHYAHFFRTEPVRRILPSLGLTQLVSESRKLRRYINFP